MTKNTTLLSLDLPLIPDHLDLEEVQNPLNPDQTGSHFREIRVNDHRWAIKYDSQSDIWWVNPRPSSTFYEILYTKLFYASPIPEQFGYASLETDGTRRAEKAVKNWEDIEKNITIEKKGRLLEIGCGPGEFLLEAKTRGWQSVFGNELEKSSADLAKSKGIEIDTGFFEDYRPMDSAGFDLIFADNVIEHTMDPLVFLRKAFELSNPNGLLVLRLPDTQPFGPTLKLIDHTFHFTRRSIKSIVEMAGYEVVSIFYSGTFKGSKYETDARQRIENMTVVAKKTP